MSLHLTVRSRVQYWGAAVRAHAGVICDVDGWLMSAEPWCVGPKGLGKQPPECLEARCSLVCKNGSLLLAASRQAESAGCLGGF